LAPDEVVQIDLVEKKIDEEEKVDNMDENIDGSGKMTDYVEAIGEKADKNVDNGEKADAAEDAKDKNSAKKFEMFENRVVTVTESNISDFSLFDVIMPAPGPNVIKTFVSEIYECL
jgi:hypothetical protein